MKQPWMSRFNPIGCALIASLALTASPGSTQDFEPTREELAPVVREGEKIKLSALLFGDLFQISENHLESFEDESGWWTRRIYTTMDVANFGLGRTELRLRLEVNQLDDFSSDYKSTLKDAYLLFKPGDHKIWVGRVPTLTFGSVEAHWNYRWFEKTPMDIQGVPSRLDGVRAAGPLGGDNFFYRVGIGESSDLGFESDKVRKAQLALTWMASERKFFVDLYGDHLEDDEGESDGTATSFQVFGGYNGEHAEAGLLYFQRDWDDLAATRLRVVSGYYSYSLPARHLALVGRIDRLLDPSVRGDGIDYIPFDPSAEATLLMGGVDIRLHDNVNIMPNVKYITYDRNDAGIRPDDDLYLNLTLYLRFSS